MGLHRALRDIQNSGDFRVVTALKKQINDLLLPAP